MSETRIISEPAGTRLFVCRESYLGICGSDVCAAALLSALERWHLYKLNVRDESRARNRSALMHGEQPDSTEELWVRLPLEASHPGDRSWSAELLGSYGLSIVKRAMAQLVTAAYCRRRAYPKYGWDRTPQ